MYYINLKTKKIVFFYIIVSVRCRHPICECKR